MKTIGIAAHSAEGGSLCFLTACRQGSVLLGKHMHPNIVVSAVPMALSMPGWKSDDYSDVAKYLTQGVQMVADAGADFFVCPDNTAHLVLEQIMAELPLPGLHIADVVCDEIISNGWQKVGLLGTRWTMTGSVYANRLSDHDLQRLIPEQSMREQLNAAIFDELCQGVFNTRTTDLFIEAIGDLKQRGADCVILGCTEIPLIIHSDNSPLPVLDSTRLLAEYAVREAITESSIDIKTGWLNIGSVNA